MLNLARRHRFVSWMLLVSSVLGMLYCLAGVVMAAWLSATPNYPLERAQFWVRTWGAGTITCFVLASAIAASLWRTRRQL